MEIIVAVFAAVVAMGCLIAIFLASRKEGKQYESE
jgi:hypothetical protein